MVEDFLIVLFLYMLIVSSMIIYICVKQQITNPN
jgi:hypothetical protein